MGRSARPSALQILILLGFAAANVGCEVSVIEDTPNGMQNEPALGNCDLEHVVDRFWEGFSSGVSRNLLLRSDGTYQLNMINGTDASGVFCQSGEWFARSDCGTIQLAACDGTRQDRTWSLESGVLAFGDARYTEYEQATTEGPFFVGCRVRRFCSGLSCGEVLTCLRECDSAIIESAECPPRCLAQISQKHEAELDALDRCLGSNCDGDGDCAPQACSEEFRVCD
jgi:hypothetical protein